MRVFTSSTAPHCSREVFVWKILLVKDNDGCYVCPLPYVFHSEVRTSGNTASGYSVMPTQSIYMLLQALLTAAAVLAAQDAPPHALLRQSAALHAQLEGYITEHGPAVPQHVRTRANALLSEHAEAMISVNAYLAGGNQSTAAANARASLMSREKQVLRAFKARGGANALEAISRFGWPTSPAMAARHLSALKQSKARAPLRATAEALLAATGIEAHDEYGALFEIMNALFEGEPPAEALGCSAKFYDDGRVQLGRYHVMLQAPCECWGFDRATVLAAARASASALRAPPLVGAWLDALAALPASAALPTLGFGVSRDDQVGKIYVMNHRADALPRLPLSTLDSDGAAAADDVLPTLAPHPTRKGAEPVRMLSLEWRLGGGAVSLRQYAAEAAARTLQQRVEVRAPAALADGLRSLVGFFGGASEDIAVTRPFVPAELRAGSPPALVSRARSKAGVKLRDAPSDEKLLDALQPGLAATTVSSEAVSRWLHQSAAVPHHVANVQLGAPFADGDGVRQAGFVTLYRHPTSFGHIDPGSATHRRLGTLVRDAAPGYPLTACERAQQITGDAFIWQGHAADDVMAVLFGNEVDYSRSFFPECNKALQAIDDADDNGEEILAMCPAACHPVFDQLIDACDTCETEWIVCADELPAGFIHPLVGYDLRTNARLEFASEAGAAEATEDCPVGQTCASYQRSSTTQTDGHEHAAFARVKNAVQALIATNFESANSDWQALPGPSGHVGWDADSYDVAVVEIENVSRPDSVGVEFELKITRDMGAAAPTTAVLLDQVKQALSASFSSGLLTQTDAFASTFTFDDAFALSALDLHLRVEDKPAGSRDKYEDLPLDAVPSDKKWLQPYGGSGLLNDMNLWAPDGCKAPFYDFWPDVPMCNQCSSLTTDVHYLGMWKGPCELEYEEDWEKASEFLPLNAPTPGQKSCSCKCAAMLQSVVDGCQTGDCTNMYYEYGGGATCSECPAPLLEDSACPTSCTPFVDSANAFDQLSIWGEELLADTCLAELAPDVWQIHSVGCYSPTFKSGDSHPALTLYGGYSPPDGNADGDANGGDGSSLPIGALIGGAAGGVVLLVAVVATGVYFCKQRPQSSSRTTPAATQMTGTLAQFAATSSTDSKVPVVVGTSVGGAQEEC